MVRTAIVYVVPAILTWRPVVVETTRAVLVRAGPCFHAAAPLVVPASVRVPPKVAFTPVRVSAVVRAFGELPVVPAGAVWNMILPPAPVPVPIPPAMVRLAPATLLPEAPEPLIV